MYLRKSTSIIVLSINGPDQLKDKDRLHVKTYGIQLMLYLRRKFVKTYVRKEG